MNDKYRKKPIVVKAFQLVEWDTETIPEEWPKWIVKAIRQHRDIGSLRRMTYSKWKVGTLEGSLLARVGDWVICGVKGEIYPCKDDIFRATYEEVKK